MTGSTQTLEYPGDQAAVASLRGRLDPRHVASLLSLGVRDLCQVEAGQRRLDEHQRETLSATYAIVTMLPTREANSIFCACHEQLSDRTLFELIPQSRGHDLTSLIAKIPHLCH